MKIIRRLFSSLILMVSVSVASCVSDGLSDGRDNIVGKEIATLAEQAESIKSTITDINILKESVEGHDVLIEGAAASLETLVSYLCSGPAWSDGTLATLAEQKALAVKLGAIYAGTDSYGSAKTCLRAIDASAGSWLGKNFGIYWSASLAQVKMSLQVESLCLEMRKQQALVEGLASDVEAGIRKDEEPKKLEAVARSLEANLACAEELAAALTATVADLETAYTAAICTMSEEPASYDSDSVVAINRTAMTALSTSEVTLESLAERVATCETAIKDLQDRLGVLEDDINDLKELLDMVQSVVFMPENSSDNVLAYYTLGPDIRDDGKMVRTPAETVTLNYLVRPASAAEALTDNTLWNDGLKIVGYYAGEITKAMSLTDFTITDVVSAGDGSGLVTITVDNSLSEEFYFKETGAKMALSLVSGKADLTSRFVEVVPTDDSGLTYVETFSLSTESFEVDEDLTYQIRATLTPENISDGTLTWTTSDEEIATVSSSGLVTGIKAGDAVITVTTNSLNEWGNKLTKTCKVKVMPNIKLVAPTYIEVGGSVEIKVESPEYIDPQYITWTSSDYRAPVDDNGKVTGSIMTYNTQDNVYDPVTITCTIGDYNPTVLTHEIRVVAPQPKGLVIPDFGDSEGQKTIKIGDAFSIGGSITPEAAASYYRVHYQASGAGNAEIATINYSTGAITTEGTPGSVTFMARIMDVEGTKYFYPAGNEVRRYVTVNVEPYWVESIILPETYEMSLEQSVTLTPEFTSDVEDVQPTFTDVAWTSSNSNIISIDEKTGKMTPLAEGTVTITATTSNDWSVPSGASPVTAECVVTVKVPTVPVVIGNYYYADGTWGSDSSRGDIIGVIFSTDSPVGEDTKLRNAYPTCSNGYVICTTEYTRNHGYLSNQYTAEWLNDYGWRDNIQRTDKAYGYSNTVAMTAYADENYGTSAYGELFHSEKGVVAVHTANVSVPSTASPWFVPSFKEMTMLYDNLSTVNTSLSAAGKTQISAASYWMSTFGVLNTYYDLKITPFDMSTGGWSTKNELYSTDCLVRVVLAF